MTSAPRSINGLVMPAGPKAEASRMRKPWSGALAGADGVPDMVWSVPGEGNGHVRFGLVQSGAVPLTEVLFGAIVRCPIVLPTTWRMGSGNLMILPNQPGGRNVAPPCNSAEVASISPARRWKF